MIFLEWQGMEGGRVRGSKQNIFLKSPALCFKGFSSARIDIICAVKSPKDKKKNVTSGSSSDFGRPFLDIPLLL